MSSQSLTTFALIALMAVAFYFLILRPQRKRQQEQQKTQNAITPGSRVMTGSGLFGTVVSVGEKQVVIEISPGVNLTLLKPAVSRVVGPEDEDGAQPLVTEPHYEPEASELDLPDTHQVVSTTEDLGPSATDVTPGRPSPAPPNPALGNDPTTKE
jgi:preprotein translocase subunit YajC